MTTGGQASSAVRRSRTTPREEQRIYVVVKERLLEGYYVGGERLVVEDLAAENGVSRQPVYDALKRLSAEGFVEIIPRVGCRVRQLDRAEIRDFFTLFAAVEGAAAAMAASRCSEADLKLLRRLNAQIGGLTDLEDASERAHGYRILNREFHSRIHQVAGTPIVETICSGLYDRSDFLINGGPSVSPMAAHLRERHADHARIIAAMEEGDPELARQATSDHLLSTVPMIEAANAEADELGGDGASGRE